MTGRKEGKRARVSDVIIFVVNVASPPPSRRMGKKNSAVMDACAAAAHRSSVLCPSLARSAA